jgi:hypothetical protein
MNVVTWPGDFVVLSCLPEMIDLIPQNKKSEHETGETDNTGGSTRIQASADWTRRGKSSNQSGTARPGVGKKGRELSLSINYEKTTKMRPLRRKSAWQAKTLSVLTTEIRYT